MTDDLETTSLADVVSAIGVLTEQLAPIMGVVIAMAVNIRIHQYWQERVDAAQAAELAGGLNDRL